MHVTLDASVFVSIYLASDAHHGLRLLGRLIEEEADLHAPTLVLAEVAAALARNTRQPKRGLAALEMIKQTPRLRLHSLSLPFAEKAARLASTLFLRSSDSIYVAVAITTGTLLITLDNEMGQRAGKEARTLTPSEWLSRPTSND